MRVYVYMRRSTFSARSQHSGRLSVGPLSLPSSILNSMIQKVTVRKSPWSISPLYILFSAGGYLTSHTPMHAARTRSFSMLVCERIYRSRDMHLTREFRNWYSFWDS